MPYKEDKEGQTADDVKKNEAKLLKI